MHVALMCQKFTIRLKLTRLPFVNFTGLLIAKNATFASVMIMVVPFDALLQTCMCLMITFQFVIRIGMFSFVQDHSRGGRTSRSRPLIILGLF